MFKFIPNSKNNLLVHSGNMLSINEVKRKAGQGSTEELLVSLRFVMAKRCVLTPYDNEPGILQVNEAADYQAMELFVPEKRKDVKVSVKVFVSSYEGQKVREAVDAALKFLRTPYIESVVLALRAGENIEKDVLQESWKVLEEYASKRLIFAIGVSDVETDVFIALYEWAKVKPGIVQINLAHCCVVPPALQSFAKDHEICLLTHSDPPDILSHQSVKEVILGESLSPDAASTGLKFSWATRYQVHIKCRGVLSSKGYVISLKK